MRYGSKRKKDTKTLENFYYETIYNVIGAPMQHEAKAIHLRHLKAKITRLHHYENKKRLRFTDEGDCLQDEEPILFQYIKARKKNKALNITQIKDSGNQIQTDPRKIIQAFAELYHKKFKTIPVQNESTQAMTKAIPNTISTNSHETQDAPITMDELQHSIRKGKLHKSPGADGIGHDFYVKTWDMCKKDLLQLLNTMFLEGKTTEAHKKEIIVCIPKKNTPTSIDDYRPLTLLNADTKLLTRILSERIKPHLQDIIHKGQYCGITNSTVYDELEKLRNTISSAEHYRKSLCVLSLDFKDACNNISHTYLFDILKAYGFSNSFQACIRDLYTGATSQVKVNGYTSRPIPIHSAIRQSCPLSMTLYAICLDPLLHAISKEIPGYRHGRTTICNAV
jgi:hypothetical protein